MIDRTRTPESGKIENIRLLEPYTNILENGLPLHIINGGIHDIVRVDLVFPAGASHAPYPLLAQAANAMLQEGTRLYTAAEIAGQLDFYGAILKTWITADTAGFTVYTLSRHLRPVMEIVRSMVAEPVFPEEELKVFLNKRRQQFGVEMKKVSYRARIRFSEMLFGKEHPYGRAPRESDFSKITGDKLAEFWENRYMSGNVWALVSGKTGCGELGILKEQLGKIGFTIRPYEPIILPENRENEENKLLEEMDHSLQSAVRIGRTTINRLHPDFPALMVLNTVLGGYFGSRLMKNIREEKGYTYGIGSYVLSLHNAGVFGIVTEVGNEYTMAAIEETRKEMHRLCNENISPGELDLVRNYMLGDILREFDGPFTTAESYKAVVEYGMDMSHYRQLIETIEQITPGQIRSLAEIYLQPSGMKEVIAGNPIVH